MKIPRLAALLFLLLPAVLSAQDGSVNPYRNHLTLTLGLHQGWFKDRNFSPLNYRSGGQAFGLRYERNTSGGDRYHLGVDATLGKLRADAPDLVPADRYRIDLSFGWQRDLTAAGSERRLSGGLNYRTRLDIVLWDDTEAITFFALHGFEAATSGSWQAADRHRLDGSLAIPVFGLLSRPPYTGWDKFIVDNADNIPKIVTRGRWTSLNDFFGLRAALRYNYALGDHWRVGAGYQLRYYATRRLDSYRSWENNFLLSTTREF